MRWEEREQGPDVIFIHGLPTSPLLWRYVLPELSGVRSIAWEMVGYGNSLATGDGLDLSVARQAEYVISWMDWMEIEQAIFIGHDAGGGVVQRVAVEHGNRVRGVVLTNSVCYDYWPIPEVKLLRSLAPLVRRMPPMTISAVLAVLFLRGHGTLEQAREALQIHNQYYRDPGSAHRFVRQLEALDAADTLQVSDHLSTLDLPAHIVWGAADPFLDLSWGERLASDLSAPIDIISAGKHFVPEDHPMHIVAAVRRVLEQA